jgi:hypothetical protein
MKRFKLFIFVLFVLGNSFSNHLFATDISESVDVKITPEYYNYGDFKVGDPPATKEFTFTNRSQMFPVFIYSVELAQDNPSFSVDISSLQIEKALMQGESRTFNVTYTPLTDNSPRDTLIFCVGDSEDASCQFEFRVVLAAGSMSSNIYVEDVKFSERKINTKSEFVPVTITNSSEHGSNERLTITRVQLSSNVKHLGHGYGFQVDTLQNISNENPLIIEVDSSYTFFVRFVPVFRGEQSGTIYFVSDAGNNEFTKSRCELYGTAYEEKIFTYKSYVPFTNHTFSYMYDELFTTYDSVTVDKMIVSGSVGDFESSDIFRIEDKYFNGNEFPFFVDVNEYIEFPFDVNIPNMGSYNAEIEFVGDFFSTKLIFDFAYREVNAYINYYQDTVRLSIGSWKSNYFKITNDLYNGTAPLIIYGVEFSGDVGLGNEGKPIFLAKDISIEKPDYINPGDSKEYQINFYSDNDGTYNGKITFLSNAEVPLEMDVTFIAGTGTSVKDDEIVEDYNIYFDRISDIIKIRLYSKNQYNITSDVYDISGQKVFTSQQNIFAGSNQLSLDASELNTGTYLIKIRNQNRTIIDDKFIIVK